MVGGACNQEVIYFEVVVVNPPVPANLTNVIRVFLSSEFSSNKFPLFYVDFRIIIFFRTREFRVYYQLIRIVYFRIIYRDSKPFCFLIIFFIRFKIYVFYGQRDIARYILLFPFG